MFSLLLALIYLAFISLGLPDALLGSAWPVMHTEINVPISYAGILSIITLLCTVVSSLLSDRLTRKFGTGLVTAVSVLTTALALFGFSVSSNFFMLCLLSIPYGLGAGSIDAALNTYVAIHYESRHMSWLHCMWGVGVSVGPYIISYSLSKNMSWNTGYLIIAIIQSIITIIMFSSLPLWKKDVEEISKETTKAISFSSLLSIVGVKEILFAFFCYSAIEQAVILWLASYLNVAKSFTPEKAAFFASLFFIGITLGRAVNGFLTIKFSDSTLIRLGMYLIAIGIFLLFLPFNSFVSVIAFLFIGLGLAPIYPSIIHSTPIYFGEDRARSMIGIQMACTYIGASIMPPVFGLLAGFLGLSIFPVYLAIILILMFLSHERVIKLTTKGGMKNKY